MPPTSPRPDLASSLASFWSDLKAQAYGTTAKTTTPPPPAAPATLPLGPFEASEAVLGEGGYAKVVLGRHRESGQRVAVKLLHTVQDPTSGRAASRESDIVREVAALRRAGAHPNVIQLHGYFRLNESTHAMVLDLCRGGELFRLVERHGACAEETVRPIYVGVLAGVRHLHAQGVAHLDLKLENILLTTPPGEGGTPVPKVCDLGLAHVHAAGPDGSGWADKELTRFCGSRSYCAPEVMARLGYNGYAADAWSLGVCLFGLVSGFFPVDEASHRDWRFERIARQQHAAPDVSTAHTIFGFYNRPCMLSPALTQLLDRMLQVAPAKRATLDDVAMAPWVHGKSELPTPAPAPAPAVDFMAHVEVDISDDAMQRSGGEYRALAPPEAAAPPLICRQRAEMSVGVAAES